MAKPLNESKHWNAQMAPVGYDEEVAPLTRTMPQITEEIMNFLERIQLQQSMLRAAIYPTTPEPRNQELQRDYTLLTDQALIETILVQIAGRNEHLLRAFYRDDSLQPATPRSPRP